MLKLDVSKKQIGQSFFIQLVIIVIDEGKILTSFLRKLRQVANGLQGNQRTILEADQCISRDHQCADGIEYEF